jgi:LmbE family N-acetylglucosaminyl deacetylase
MVKKVLVIVPHPDDAEFSAGGLICQLAADGAYIILVTVTDGGKASFHFSRADLAGVRNKELKRAAKVMGVQETIELHYPDFELDQLPTGKLREQLILLIRRYKPDLLITQDPLDAQELHPDHKAVSQAAAEAVSFSHLPLIYPEQIDAGLNPHFVIEKYYYSDNPACWNKFIDISATFEKKIAAIGEHKSQVGFLVEEIYYQAKLAGIDLMAVLGEAAEDNLATVRWAVESQAREIGKQISCTYAEAFRYVRFHPYIESILTTHEQ